MQVADAKELEIVLALLLKNSSRREQLGRNGLAVVRQNLGAIERTTEMILNGVDGSGIYIVPPK
jgi:3-deoxy-D-manno-octulosonic-acid transferase